MTIHETIPWITRSVHALALIMMGGTIVVWTLHAMPARADEGDDCPVTTTIAELQQAIAAQHG